MHGLDDLLRFLVLHQVASSACLEGIDQVLPDIGDGEHQDVDVRQLPPDPARRLNAVALRHVEVHEDQGEAKGPGLLHGLVPVAGLDYNLQGLLAAQCLHQASPDHGVIAYKQRPEAARLDDIRCDAGSLIDAELGGGSTAIIGSDLSSQLWAGERMLPLFQAYPSRPCV